MSILDDQPLERSTLEPPPASPHGARRSDLVRLTIALVAIAIVIGGIFAARRWFAPVEAPDTLRPPGTGAVQARDTAPPPPPAVDLPPASEMDPFIRSLVGGLSSRPELARWLTTDDLTTHIASAVDQLARGLSPARDAKVIAPSGPFSTTKRGGREVIAPESYARYDGLAATAASIDPAAAARVYRTLSPRLSEAYRLLGRPDGDLDAAVQAAIVTLLATPPVTGPVEVVPGRGNTYAFADGRLESLKPAQKQLLRMGPENARLVQDQLRELARALGIPDARLPER